MKFAKVVFTLGGIWGLAVVTPLYFMFDYVGRQYPPAITHADMYYGFVCVTLVWQIAFLIIATDPIRYRPMIMVAILEKFSYVATMVTLYAKGDLLLGQAAVAAPDSIVGVLFVLAFMATASGASHVARR
ncbi:MAG TPA: hypothetical protein VHU82_06375 [Vicinamibacterales bacterium]|nr:hypothetical protein [Vicinamibacterales bacterium]